MRFLRRYRDATKGRTVAVGMKPTATVRDRSRGRGGGAGLQKEPGLKPSFTGQRIGRRMSPLPTKACARQRRLHRRSLGGDQVFIAQTVTGGADQHFQHRHAMAKQQSGPTAISALNNLAESGIPDRQAKSTSRTVRSSAPVRALGTGLFLRSSRTHRPYDNADPPCRAAIPKSALLCLTSET